jgi:transketolase
MRNVFFDALFEKMAEDESLFFVTADMGLGIVERFEQHYPDRIVNVGIAEQNMIGVAAGLANLGYRPVCYTISNFLVHRCLEQIRNDICLHEYPIMLVGTSTGFDNGKLGPTHQVIDDIGPIKALPKIRIYSPGSDSGMENVVAAAFSENNPCYIRLGKGGMDTKETTLNGLVRCNGKDELIITHGTLLEDVINNSAADVLMINQVHPLSGANLDLDIFSNYKHVSIVEDQNHISGLYNSMCQLFNENGILKSIKTDTLDMSDGYIDVIGDAQYLKQRCLKASAL